MRKIAVLLPIFIGSFFAKAQYAKINALLDKIEARQGINQDLSKISLEGKRFVMIEKNTEQSIRNFLTINGAVANYIRVSEDTTGKTTSQIYTGDVVRTEDNILSFRFDRLENERIPLPVTKTLLLKSENNILYLSDVNTRERWIDETMLRRR